MGQGRRLTRRYAGLPGLPARPGRPAYTPLVVDDTTETEPSAGADGARRTRADRRRPRRRRRAVLLAALIVVLVPVLAVLGYLGYLNHLATVNVQHADLLPPAGATALPSGQPGSQPGATNSATDPDLDPGEPGPGIAPGAALVPATSVGDNYLLIGSDARAGLAGGRSDVIILVHVPVDHHNVTLIHFPRDMYVPIPGHGTNKINAAYAFGGAPLLVATMQNLLGIHIDHAAYIGFEGFKRMIDAVGGVDVVVEEGGTIDGYVFTKGQMHLDGPAALSFVRERYDLSQGDLSRGHRQQAVLKALLLKALSAQTLTNPGELAAFVDAATANTTVDSSLDVGTMRSELFAARGLRAGDIRFITAPITGFGSTSAGASIDLVDWARIAELGLDIRTDTLDNY